MDAYDRMGRFWSNVDRARFFGDDERCWEWQGAKTTGGYGATTGFDGKWIRAHRMAYRIAKGPIPTGLMVCHHCDNPPCCNPKHLYAGTALDNARDAVNRRRLRDLPFPTPTPEARTA